MNPSVWYSFWSLSDVLSFVDVGELVRPQKLWLAWKQPEEGRQAGPAQQWEALVYLSAKS